MGHHHHEGHDHGEHAHHDHGGEHQHHHHHANASERRLTGALALLGAFTLVEGVGGLWANSIALLAEAAHMLADSASLVLAIVAIRMARRPASDAKSYGHERYQTLAAYTNGVALIVLTAWVVVEAIQRLMLPPVVDAKLMLGVAVIGAIANLCAFLVLSGGHSLNERGARAHVLADLLGSGAAILAACLIWSLGWLPADALLSIFVSVLIFRSGVDLARESSHVLLQGTPAGFDADQVKSDLAQVAGVSEVHHLHAWSLTGEAPIVTLHATTAAGASRQVTLAAILARLRERFGVEHATIQIEEGGCADPEDGVKPCRH